jgi:uncharacterized damage-inducible protein DinB
MTTETFRQLFTYDAWGNRAMLDSLRLSTQAPTSRACAITAHLIGAGRTWLDRLHGRVPSMEVWPALSLDQCDTGFRELDAAWSEYLGGLSAGDLGREITYTNSKGESWTSTIREILMHVILHGTYHRGQIAMLVRQSGHAPAYTDFIEATRRGLVS